MHSRHGRVHTSIDNSRHNIEKFQGQLNFGVEVLPATTTAVANRASLLLDGLGWMQR
jgi:hypothetical protein